MSFCYKSKHSSNIFFYQLWVYGVFCKKITVQTVVIVTANHTCQYQEFVPVLCVKTFHLLFFQRRTMLREWKKTDENLVLEVGFLCIRSSGSGSRKVKNGRQERIRWGIFMLLKRWLQAFSEELFTVFLEKNCLNFFHFPFLKFSL